MNNSDTSTVEPTPPSTLRPIQRRDANGLLVGVNYPMLPDGSIHWRAMIKAEYLVPNKQNFERHGQSVPESVEGLEDKDLLILLGGLKELAKLRGYTSITHTPTSSSPDFVSVKTRIEWIPNFETDGLRVVSEALADAHPGNTSGFAKHYLSAIAENRGFVRAVRNFLGIYVVGQDEVGPTESDAEASTDSKGGAQQFLASFLKKHKVAFESFQNKMIELQIEGAADWGSVADVPAARAFELVDVVKGLIEAKKKAKQG